ncbi:TIM barrel protein [Alphaproteobacteria bacterium]|nr:TIM barrel protein [Alphaproteobacteria bacterium]
MFKAVKKETISENNQSIKSSLDFDFEYLEKKLNKDHVDIRLILDQVKKFQVAVPTWGVGTGGTRFARFPGIGEPQNIYDKIEDCAVINDLIGFTNKVSPHFPWDNVDDFSELKEFADGYGIGFDVVNSNTFQDPADGKETFKYGSLTNSSSLIRDKAIEVNTKSIENGKALGSKGLTVWIGDGGNFPGQMSFSKSLERYIDSMKKIYAYLPEDWTVLLEHKPYEPAFYSTVISDWGTSYICAKELGDQAMCLVDLGHHLPNTNIEMIVSRLIDVNKLGGFHFNDSKFGDDDLDAGSINPYELFLIFNELTAASQNNKIKNIAYMIDQSHNVTDPIESLILSANEIVSSYAKSLLVNYSLLDKAQDNNDAIQSMQILKTAFNTDVSPIVAMARYENGNSIDPISTYRTLDYKKKKSLTRKNKSGSSSGIV